jgi:acetaldehyde dehydrogenase (acetylating)
VTTRDKDLHSIQEARDLVARAAEAQKKFSTFSQQQLDVVVEACAEAATSAGEQLARLAVEETGYGNVPDKIIKNRLASVEVPKAIRGMKTVGILSEDREKGIVEAATPVGVVAAVIPSTNPTSTAIYKTLISLKAGNAIVHSPHPSAARCICETVSVLTRAALKAGAPEGLIGCMLHTTLQGTQELMRHREVGVILATGGTGLVRAAYGSGKPAYGVGPGNVPACIERTANIRKAVADVIAGKTFDYGTICSSEQSIVTEDAVREQVLEECRRQGAYFLSAEEAKKLADVVIDPVRRVPNNRIVGRPATVIAEFVGIKVPRETRVLIARLEPEQVGREFPLSAEKLSPILAFYSVPNFAVAVDLCKRLLHFGGLGHTSAIHTQSAEAARQFGLAVPTFRVCVNTAAVHGSIGNSTNLFPAMTLGCGSPGGNITSDNIGPMHLLNVKRIAWESRPVEHRTISADQRLSGSAAPPEQAATATASAAAASSPAQAAAKERAASAPEPSAAPTPPAKLDREVIAKVVHRVLEQHGIPHGGELKPVHPESAEGGRRAVQSPSQIASEIASRVFGAPLTAAPAQAAAAAAGAGDTGRSQSEAPASPSIKASSPAAAEIKVAPFVSETDVRTAITRQEKIFIGPKTIVTPAARDLGVAHDILVETQFAPAKH